MVSNAHIKLVSIIHWCGLYMSNLLLLSIDVVCTCQNCFYYQLMWFVFWRVISVST